MSLYPSRQGTNIGSDLWAKLWTPASMEHDGSLQFYADGLPEDLAWEDNEEGIDLWFDIDAYCNNRVADNESQFSDTSSLETQLSTSSMTSTEPEYETSASRSAFRVSQLLDAQSNVASGNVPATSVDADAATSIQAVPAKTYSQYANANNQRSTFIDSVEDRKIRNRSASKRFRRRGKERQSMLRQRLDMMLERQRHLRKTVNDLEAENKLARQILTGDLKPREV